MFSTCMFYSKPYPCLYPYPHCTSGHVAVITILQCLAAGRVKPPLVDRPIQSKENVSMDRIWSIGICSTVLLDDILHLEIGS